MRGETDPQKQLFHHLVNWETLIPEDHPLRGIRERVDAELRRMNSHFEAAYAKVGRPSIPPEQLIKATMLQAMYSISSERRLCEQIKYNLLFRWFLDLSPDGPTWDHSTFSANRKRFAEHGLMEKFFAGSVATAVREEVVSDDHFSVDGTLIQSWGSMKSVRRKDEKTPKPPSGGSDSNGWTNWHGEKRTNETHQSVTDPEARLARKGKGQGALLSHSMHTLMENRNGLLLDIQVAEANGTAERETTHTMLGNVKRRHHLKPKTLGADKGYDDGSYLLALETRWNLKPHVAIREGVIVQDTPEAEARRRARRRQKTQGYSKSQRRRKRIEECFGWLKEVAGLRKASWVGRWKIQLYAYASAAAYNFLRMTKLCGA